MVFLSSVAVIGVFNPAEVIIEGSSSTTPIDVGQADLLVVDSATKKLYGINLTRALMDGHSENAVIFNTSLYNETGGEIGASPLGVAYYADPTYPEQSRLYVSFDDKTLYAWDRHLNFLKKNSDTNYVLSRINDVVAGVTKGNNTIYKYCFYDPGFPLWDQDVVARPSGDWAGDAFPPKFYNLSGITATKDIHGNLEYVISSSNLKSISTGPHIANEAPFQHGCPDAIAALRSFDSPYFIRSGKTIYRMRKTTAFDNVMMCYSPYFYPKRPEWYMRFDGRWVELFSELWGIGYRFRQTVWKYKPGVQETAEGPYWMNIVPDLYFNGYMQVGLYKRGDFDPETVTFREFPPSIKEPGYVDLKKVTQLDKGFQKFNIDDFTSSYLIKPYNSTCSPAEHGESLIYFSHDVFHDKNSDALWYNNVHYEPYPDKNNIFILPSEVTSPEDIEVINDVDVIEIKGNVTDGRFDIYSGKKVKHLLKKVNVTLNWGGKLFSKHTDEGGKFKFAVLDRIGSGKEGYLQVELSAKDDIIRVFDDSSDRNNPVWFRTKNFTIDSEADLNRTINALTTKFHSTNVMGEYPKVSDLAAIYYYTYMAAKFAKDHLNLTLANSNGKVKVYAFVKGTPTWGSWTAWKDTREPGYEYRIRKRNVQTAYSPSAKTIYIDEIDSPFLEPNEVEVQAEYRNKTTQQIVKYREGRGGPDRPDNREFHEYSHHIMTVSDIGGSGRLPSMAGCKNHGGYANPNSSDSWVEGFAEFMSMVISDTMTDDAYPQVYMAFGNFFNLERNFNVTRTEEFAVAGILWDLYDGIKEEFDTSYHKYSDNIQLPLKTLWAVLNNPVGRGNVKEVYDAFHSTPGIDTTALDHIFILHGAYNDTNNDGQYASGEPVGFTSWLDKTNRPKTPPIPGGYLYLTVKDNITGENIDHAELLVQIEHSPPCDIYDYNFTIQMTGLPANVPLAMTPYPAEVRIIARVNGYYDSEPLLMNSTFYWEHAGDAAVIQNKTLDCLLDHTFLVEPTPDIAVTNVTLSKTVVGQGYSVSINVTVENQGVYAETFNVTVYSQPPSLVGYWNFDEGSGTTAYDSSGYNNNGTLCNGPTWVEGKYGKALSFDGVDDYVRVADSDSLDVTNDITIEAWVKTDGWTGTDQVIVSKFDYPSADEAYALYISEGEIGFILSSDGGTTGRTHLTSTYTLNIDQWYHIVATYSSSDSTTKLYVNGSYIDSTTHTGGIYNSAQPLKIGIVNAANQAPFNGRIDEVKIYNRALSEEEIVANMMLYGKIQTKNVTLTSGNSTTITFTWNTTGVAKGNYTISAYATPVSDETNTTDNTLIDGFVIVSCLGDLNGDYIVDGQDYQLVKIAVPSMPGSPKWNPNADLNDDGIVDGQDFQIVKSLIGTSAP